MRGKYKNDLDTKLKLMASLKELMLEKSLKTITIQAIMSYIGINRNTFYYHKEKHILLAKKYKNFICTFLAYAIGSTFVDYYSKDEKLTKKEVIHYYSMTIQTFITHISYDNYLRCV